MSYVIDPDGVEVGVVHDLVDFEETRVLEAGCGDGRLTWRYANRAKSVLAYDLSEEKVERARANTPFELAGRVQFVAEDVTAADLPAYAFEVAILSYSL